MVNNSHKRVTRHRLTRLVWCMGCGNGIVPHLLKDWICPSCQAKIVEARENSRLQSEPDPVNE